MMYVLPDSDYSHYFVKILRDMTQKAKSVTLDTWGNWEEYLNSINKISPFTDRKKKFNKIKCC